ncbi:Thymidine kinase [compost metagenome]
MASLHFRYSSMNAGKSTYLLQAAHNYEENGRQVALFTSAQDDRDGVGIIASRIGLRRQARTYAPEDNFFELLAGISTETACVLVDEAQFLTADQVKQLHRWVHTNGVPVMCFGIRSDFRGEPFPGSAALLALADKLEEMKTICACGKRATMNLRIGEDGRPVSEGNQVEIGGNNRYRQVCGRCFYGCDVQGSAAPAAPVSLGTPVTTREMALAIKKWWTDGPSSSRPNGHHNSFFDGEPDFVRQARTVLGEHGLW